MSAWPIAQRCGTARSFASRTALALALAVCGCSQPQTCREAAGRSQSALAKAPRNGAQFGGMTIDPGGVSEGSGAPGAAASAGFGILRIYVVLQAPGAGLSDAAKSALLGALADVRDTGSVQVILRFYYQDALTSKSNAADTAAKIGADINAAKVVVSPYLDVIAFIQAGFLGPWGEWWGGDLEGADFGSDQQLRTLKTGVVDALESAFPGTFIQLRYPRDIATYYADDPQIAFHDDSVLAGSDDGGTFNATKKCALWPDGDPDKQRAWIKQRSASLSSVNSGEASEATPDVSCDALLTYLKEYRIEVFNGQWPAVVTKCADLLKSQLAWSGPLGPSGSAEGGGGASSGGSTAVDPNFGTELGCWASDQRPWQLCNPAGCPSDRCRRAAADPDCAMYRAAACTGSWPPPGYPGEENAPSAAGGASSGGASAGGTASSGSSGAGSSGGVLVVPNGGSSSAPDGGGSSAVGVGTSAGGSAVPAASSPLGSTSAPPSSEQGGC